MGQAYRIDRLRIITYKGQKKKEMKSLRCRYMAKSLVVNCNAQSQSFEFVKFRGSHFKNVIFKMQNSKIVCSWQVYLGIAVLLEQHFLILLLSILSLLIALVLINALEYFCIAPIQNAT